MLFVGTGWQERQALLEGVDWSGINLRLRGLFPFMAADSPLRPFYHEGAVPNAELPRAYAACKIALNPYRQGDGAESMNPRAYELAACGVFQLSDYRAEAEDVFGPHACYSSSAELETLIRHYLANDDERAVRIETNRILVQGHTFDRRVADLMTTVTARRAAA